MNNAILIALAVAALSSTTFMASAGTSVDGYDGKGQVGIKSKPFKNAAANTYKLKHCSNVGVDDLRAEIDSDIHKAAKRTGIPKDRISDLVDKRAQKIEASFIKDETDASWICSTANVEDFNYFGAFAWSQIPASEALKAESPPDKHNFESYSKVVINMLNAKVCENAEVFQDMRLAANASARDLGLSAGEIMHFAHNQTNRIISQTHTADQYANLKNSLCVTKGARIAVSPIPEMANDRLLGKLADKEIKALAIEVIALRSDAKTCGLTNAELKVADEARVEREKRIKDIGFDDEFLSVGAWTMPERAEIFSKRFGSNSACDVVKQLISNVRNNEVGGEW